MKNYFRITLGIALSISLSPCLFAQQQIVQGAASDSTPDSGIALSVPPVKGFNFIVSSGSQYDGANGWSSQLSPLLTFRINRFFSLDSGLPVYLAVNYQTVKGTRLAPVYVQNTAHGVIGDTAISGHFDLDGSWLSYSFTASGAFPTGNSQANLSANAKTYSVNNHFEHSFGIFTPDIEIGEGDSTSLNGTAVRRAYVAVGPLATFQVGTWVDLPAKLSLDFEAYESMPIGNQKVYGTFKTKKGKTVTVLQGTGVAEDNGLNIACSYQPNPHFGVTAFFNRSLRQYDNTTGFSLTYIARAPRLASAR